MDELIRVNDIEKYYGNGEHITKAVDRVSFTVAKGEFMGIMGASGSGKTTLLNMISTIDHVTSGHIYYGSTDITELSENKLADFRKENLGFVFQDFNLLDTLTIEENIILSMTLHKKTKKEILDKCHHPHGNPRCIFCKLLPQNPVPERRENISRTGARRQRPQDIFE